MTTTDELDLALPALDVREPFKRALEAASIELAVLDSNARVIFASPAAGDSYWPIFERIVDQAGDTTALQSIAAVLEGRIERFDIDYPADRGSDSRWRRLSIVSLNEGPGTAVVTTDVTENHRSAEQITRLTEELSLHSLRAAAEGRTGGFARSASVKLCSGSPVMRAVLSKVERVAGTNATVLLLGEPGTGATGLKRKSCFAWMSSRPPTAGYR